MCNKCNGTGVISVVVCGLCEENLPHSSCDDTWSINKDCGCRLLQSSNSYKINHWRQYSQAKCHTGRETLIAMLMRELK